MFRGGPPGGVVESLPRLVARLRRSTRRHSFMSLVCLCPGYLRLASYHVRSQFGLADMDYSDVG